MTERKRATRQGSEVRREQIAGAALRVIAGYGMRGLTVVRIAAEVGVVPSAVYRHFRSKEEILDAVFELLHGRFLENVRAARAEAGEPLAALGLLLERQVRLFREFAVLPRVLFSDEVQSGPERRGPAMAMFRDFLAGVAGLVAEGQAAGAIRGDLEPRTAAVMFVGLFQPGIVIWHLSGGQFDLEGHVREAWRIFKSAIEVGRAGGA